MSSSALGTKGGSYYYNIRGLSRTKAACTHEDFQRMIDAKAIERIRLHHMQKHEIYFRLRETEPLRSPLQFTATETIAVIFHKRINLGELTFLEKEVIPANLALLAKQNIKCIIIQTDLQYYEFLIDSNPDLKRLLELEDIQDSTPQQGLMYDRVAARLALLRRWKEHSRSLEYGLIMGSIKCILFVDSDLFLNINRLIAAFASFGDKPQSYLFYTSSDWQWGINEGLIAFTSATFEELATTACQFFTLIERIYSFAGNDARIHAAWHSPFNWRCGQAILNALIPRESVVGYGDIVEIDDLMVRFLPGHLYNHVFTPIYNELYKYSDSYICSIHLTGTDKKSLMPLAQRMMATWGQS